jgi:hypothetical protein
MKNKKLIIENPDGTVVENPDTAQIEYLKGKTMNLLDTFWSQGNGEMIITEYYNPKEYSTLMIFPNPEYGIYLRYEGRNEDAGTEWLSLEDISKLGEEVAEYSFEMYASIGLFVTTNDAWEAIEYFCLTGERTSAIEWISCENVPEQCNY